MNHRSTSSQFQPSHRAAGFLMARGADRLVVPNGNHRGGTQADRDRYCALRSQGWRPVAAVDDPAAAPDVIGDALIDDDAHGGDDDAREARLGNGPSGTAPTVPAQIVADTDSARATGRVPALRAVEHTNVSPSGRAVAAELARLLGRHRHPGRRSRLDARRLAVAVAAGTDPVPALTKRRKRTSTRPAVLITADESGSTVGWGGYGRATARELAAVLHRLGFDVLCATNFNGSVRTGPLTWVDMVDAARANGDDTVVIYLGDSDGDDECAETSAAGFRVVQLSNENSRYGTPRLKTVSAGHVRVTGVTPSRWQDVDAFIARALQRLN